MKGVILGSGGWEIRFPKRRDYKSTDWRKSCQPNKRVSSVIILIINHLREKKKTLQFVYFFPLGKMNSHDSSVETM